MVETIKSNFYSNDIVTSVDRLVKWNNNNKKKKKKKKKEKEKVKEKEKKFVLGGGRVK